MNQEIDKRMVLINKNNMKVLENLTKSFESNSFLNSFKNEDKINQNPLPVDDIQNLEVSQYNDIDNYNIFDNNNVEYDNLYSNILTTLDFNKPKTTITSKNKVVSYLYLVNENNRISEDGCDYLILGSKQGNIVLYKVNFNEKMENSPYTKEFESHSAGINCIIDINHWKTNFFATGSNDQTVKIFDINNVFPKYVINNIGNSVICMCTLLFENNYQSYKLALGLGDGKLKLYNLDSNHNFNLYKETTYVIDYNLISEDEESDSNSNSYNDNDNNNYSDHQCFLNNFDNLLIAMYFNGQIISYRADNLHLLNKYDKEQNGGSINGLKFYKQLLFISFDYYDKNVKLWDINCPASIYTFDTDSFNFSSFIYSAEIFFDFDKEILLVGLKKKKILLIDLETKKVLKKISTNTQHRLAKIFKAKNYCSLISINQDKEVMITKIDY